MANRGGRCVKIREEKNRNKNLCWEEKYLSTAQDVPGGKVLKYRPGCAGGKNTDSFLVYSELELLQRAIPELISSTNAHLRNYKS